MFNYFLSNQETCSRELLQINKQQWMVLQYSFISVQKRSDIWSCVYMRQLPVSINFLSFSSEDRVLDHS